jgi:hypothetical protein
VRCAVIALSMIPKAPGDKVKTDKRDCRRLARLYRAGELVAIRVPSVSEEAVRDLCRTRGDMVEDLTQAPGPSVRVVPEVLRGVVSAGAVGARAKGHLRAAIVRAATLVVVFVALGLIPTTYLDRNDWLAAILGLLAFAALAVTVVEIPVAIVLRRRTKRRPDQASRERYGYYTSQLPGTSEDNTPKPAARAERAHHPEPWTPPKAPPENEGIRRPRQSRLDHLDPAMAVLAALAVSSAGMAVAIAFAFSVPITNSNDQPIPPGPTWAARTVGVVGALLLLAAMARGVLCRFCRGHGQLGLTSKSLRIDDATQSRPTPWMAAVGVAEGILGAAAGIAIGIIGTNTNMDSLPDMALRVVLVALLGLPWASSPWCSARWPRAAIGRIDGRDRPPSWEGSPLLPLSWERSRRPTAAGHDAAGRYSRSYRGAGARRHRCTRPPGQARSRTSSESESRGCVGSVGESCGSR